MIGSDRLLKPDFVVQTVPKIKISQASRLLIKALDAHKAKEQAKLEITESNIKDTIKVDLDNVDERAKVIYENVAISEQMLLRYDAMQIPGDPEYDYSFGHLAAWTDEDVAKGMTLAVAEVSTGIQQVLSTKIATLEGWQDRFEASQDTMHGVITEMEAMISQQAADLADISEATSLLCASGESYKSSGAARSSPMLKNAGAGRSSP